MILILAFTTSQWLFFLAGLVAVNAIPAFMPPTWSLLAYAHLHEGMSIWTLAALGAIGATTGRALLALGSRIGGTRIVPRRWQHNISMLVETIRIRKTLSFSMLALFALGPIPTNHLFIAAGLAGTPLPPLLLVFGIARFLSYLVWISVADTAASSIGDAIRPSWGSGAALAIQALGFLLLILVMQIDWTRILHRLSARSTTHLEVLDHGPE